MLYSLWIFAYTQYVDNCDSDSEIDHVVLTITLYHCERNVLMHFHNLLHMLQQMVQHMGITVVSISRERDINGFVL